MPSQPPSVSPPAASHCRCAASASRSASPARHRTIWNGRSPSTRSSTSAPPHTYLVRAAGDCMEGGGIFDGDLMVVDRSREEQANDFVIAALNSEQMVKRLTYEGGQIVLRSENPCYAPRWILEGDELTIWGVVRYRVRCHEPR